MRIFLPLRPKKRREEKGRKRDAVCAYANQPLLRTKRAKKKGEAARPLAIENEREEKRSEGRGRRRREEEKEWEEKNEKVTDAMRAT